MQSLTTRLALLGPRTATLAPRLFSSSSIVSAKQAKPKAPKQITNKWQLYVKEYTQELKDQGQKPTGKDLLPAAAAAYKQLSSQDHQGLEQRLAEERKRYNTQVEDFKATGAAMPQRPRKNYSRTERLQQKYPGIKPPEAAKSGYVRFADDVRAKHPGDTISFNEIAKQWKELNEAEREEWRQRAKPEQEAYRKSRAEYDQRVKDAFGKQKKPAAVEGEKKERKKRAPQAAL